MHGVECCFALPLGSVMLHRTYLDFSSSPFFMVAEHSCKSQTMHADCAWFIFSHFATIWLWNAHMLVIAVQGLIRTKSIMFLLAYLAVHGATCWTPGASVHSMCVSQPSAPSVTMKPLAMWSDKRRIFSGLGSLMSPLGTRVRIPSLSCSLGARRAGSSTHRSCGRASRATSAWVVGSGARRRDGGSARRANSSALRASSSARRASSHRRTPWPTASPLAEHRLCFLRVDFQVVLNGKEGSVSEPHSFLTQPTWFGWCTDKWQTRQVQLQAAVRTQKPWG